MYPLHCTSYNMHFTVQKDGFITKFFLSKEVPQTKQDSLMRGRDATIS